MTSYKFSNRNKSIAEQVSLMRSKYPQFATKMDSFNAMRVEGSLRPTARSIDYRFRLLYTFNQAPKVKILSPVLVRNSSGDSIPHVYKNGNLCLYRPKYGEFTAKDFLFDTIISWISLWLYHYEVWHLTGEWLGGGEHPS